MEASGDPDTVIEGWNGGLATSVMLHWSSVVSLFIMEHILTEC